MLRAEFTPQFQRDAKRLKAKHVGLAGHRGRRRRRHGAGGAVSRRLPCRWLRAPAQAGRTRAGPPPFFAQKREAIHLLGTQNLA